mmetsp:Transcript_97811/g.218902  ORF Transcript_97811/g.218902 Transcript_97811/m.218902 type:complete len:499 (-) Transcript_97811:98-1594(-)
MDQIFPTTWLTRSRTEDRAIYYPEPWMSAQVEEYADMTQQQFQEAVSPYTNTGSSLSISMSKGCRRMELAAPGKHAYITGFGTGGGTISRFGKEYYDTERECWCHPDGTRISEEDLAKGPEARALDTALELGREAMQAVQGRREKQQEEEKQKANREADENAKMEEEKLEQVKPTIQEVVVPRPRVPSIPVALIFPGQGSQYVKMLSAVRDLPAVKDMLVKAHTILGFDLLDLCLKGPESRLEMTKYCQPAMYIGGLAGVEKLRQDKPDTTTRMQAVAGLSLGEYTALTVAGVFDFELGMKIVKLRGEAIMEASEAPRQSMLSVAGLSEDQLIQLCKECSQKPGDVCQIANCLFPNGFSCAGTAEAVERLMAKARSSEGCLQAKLLRQSGAFHTTLMQPAKEKVLKFLWENVDKMKSPTCDVYMNYTGDKIGPDTTPAEIIPLLGDQITGCVQWEPCMKKMILDGIASFYECGPMKQLKAMMKRIDPASFKTTVTIDV